MAHTQLKIQPNPTRLPEPVTSAAETPTRLVDTPESAPLQQTTFDTRLRPWGTAAIAAWIGTILGIAMARQLRRKHA